MEEKSMVPTYIVGGHAMDLVGALLQRGMASLGEIVAPSTTGDRQSGRRKAPSRCSMAPT